MLPTDVGRFGDGNESEGDPYEILKFNLDAAYESNRAPLPFFIHEYWFDGVSWCNALLCLWVKRVSSPRAHILGVLLKMYTGT